MSILNAEDAVTAVGASAGVTSMPALASPDIAVLAGPVLRAFTFAEDVALSVGNTDITVAS